MAREILTTKLWVKKAREKRGDIYDYSKVDYKGSNIPIEIICKEHGSFWQKPKDHLYGNNCPKCRKSRKMSRVDFLKKVDKKWGHLYDTSLVEYRGSKEPITLLCSHHGTFTLSAYRFLMGQGCPACGRDIGGLKRRMSWETFLKKARKVHGNKYTYNKVDISKGASTDDLIITCEKHGDFRVSLSNFLKGSGCPKCAVSYSYTEKEYKLECEKLYGDDYKIINYRGLSKPVIIQCKKHGEVSVYSGRRFLNGGGCPSCYREKSRSRGESTIAFYLKRAGVKYKPQARFSECTYKQQLPFDFYVPKYNMCIEYQGVQHYKAVAHFGGEKTLSIQRKRDRIKKQFCESSGKKLLLISYTEDIKEKLITCIPECRRLSQGD